MRCDGMAFPDPGIKETQHASHVASDVPHCGNETKSTGIIVNGEGGAFETVSGVDTCGRCAE